MPRVSTGEPRPLPRGLLAAPLLLAGLVLAPGALAQPATPPPGAAPKGPAAPSAGPTLTQTPEPQPIDVSDPLLAPVSPAQHGVASWRDVLALVSARSVDLILARQELEKAEGLRRQALAGALPTVLATAGVGHELIAPVAVDPQLAQSVPQTVGSAQLAITQPLLAPRAWYGIETAKLVGKSASLTWQDKRRTVLAAAAVSVVAVVTAERVAQLNREGLKGALQRLELTRRMMRIGTGTRLDVVRAEQDAMVARIALASGDEALQRSREALGLLLGSSEGYGVPATISLDELSADVGTTCAPGSPEDRADVLAARSAVDVSRRGITDAKLAFAPTAALTSTTNLSTYQYAQANGRAYDWSIQALLTIPLWEGGARYGALRIARADEQEKKALLDVAGRQARLDVAQAVRAIGVAEQAHALSETNRDLARETALLSKEAYRLGKAGVTSFDLVDSGRKEREAELDLAQKEVDLIQAKLTALLASASCTY